MANPELENHASESRSLSDEVWSRVVQIVQEAMLTGTDCVDLLRQIRVKQGDDGQLCLTDGYKQLVREFHKQLLDDVARLQKPGS